MIKSFGNKQTEDIYHKNKSKKALRLPKELIKIAERKLDMLNAANDIVDLKIPPSNRLHKLAGDLKKFNSISINSQWRIIFIWKTGDAHEVEIIDYH